MRAGEYNELRAFAAVIRHGSFARAAAHLGLSPSALSQLIRSLEERLGQRLLNRTTRSVAPSHAGQALAERLLPVLDDLEGVVDAAFAAGGEVAGRLRIDVVRVAIPYLSRLVPGFLARYPRVRLEVATNDALVDIVALGFDAGIRLAERLEGDMVAVPFGGELRLICVASPAYLARHPAPVHPRDLADHACLVTITPSTGSPYRWEFEKGGEALRIAVDGPLVSRDADLRVAAAVAGVGIGFFFEDEVEAPLATGALVQVLADWTPAFPGAYLYYPSRRNPAPPLRAFVDYVREMGRGQILPEG
jgi:DNA-binding transcriptional LysR family regulator